MPAPQNDTLIRALFRQPTAYTPVWLMRQAGRYLPEYNEARRRAGSFLALCKTPSLAAEGTLQPLGRFPLDAAILFSDILTIPDAMGLGLYFAEGEGPRFERPPRNEASIEAGVNVVMIFDTWGGSLSAASYREFSLEYIQNVLSQLKHGSGAARVPVIVFTKGGAPWLERIAATGCDCVGLDWSIELGDARRRIGAGAALQGNLDPAVLLASPQVVRREVQKALESFGSGVGHVFNLGHGVPRFTPPENVAALVAAVRGLSPKFH